VAAQGVGTGLFERLHERLAGDAWLVGRVTGQEFAKSADDSTLKAAPFSRLPSLYKVTLSP
jgi:hypothetical protein